VEFLVIFQKYYLPGLTTEQVLHRNIYLFICYLVVILFYGFPFWSGLAFTHLVNNKMSNYQVTVPDYYARAADWLNSKGHRYLTLPIDGEGITYAWPMPYTGVEISNMLFMSRGALEKPNMHLVDLMDWLLHVWI
jgi:hypothetical protein